VQWTFVIGMKQLTLAVPVLNRTAGAPALNRFS
jgi:hypothetical protein